MAYSVHMKPLLILLICLSLYTPTFSQGWNLYVGGGPQLSSSVVKKGSQLAEIALSPSAGYDRGTIIIPTQPEYKAGAGGFAYLLAEKVIDDRWCFTAQFGINHIRFRSTTKRTLPDGLMSIIQDNLAYYNGDSIGITNSYDYVYNPDGSIIYESNGYPKVAPQKTEPLSVRSFPNAGEIVLLSLDQKVGTRYQLNNRWKALFSIGISYTLFSRYTTLVVEETILHPEFSGLQSRQQFTEDRKNGKEAFSDINGVVEAGITYQLTKRLEMTGGIQQTFTNFSSENNHQLGNLLPSKMYPVVLRMGIAYQLKSW